MFTGIVEEVGAVKELRVSGREASMAVTCRKIWKGLDLGDSVAVNGVCLTVTAAGGGEFTADISEESLSRTTLGGLSRGRRVNLERALTPQSRLGGHIVQGHVDGVGEVAAIRQVGEGRVYAFSCPAYIRSYLVEKGSIAVDGISLTISSLEGDGFCVAAVPHTIEGTNLKGLRPGDKVNLEVDIISKYVKAYLERGLPAAASEERDSTFYRKLIEGGFA